VSSAAVGTLSLNSPWTGFATANGGGRAILAGPGVYALESSGGYAELGIKIR